MTMNGNQGFGGTNQGHEPTSEELEAAKKGAEVEAGDAAETAEPAETQETAPETNEPATPDTTVPTQPSAPANQVAPEAPATTETTPEAPSAPEETTDEVEVTQAHLDTYPQLIERGIELGQKILKSVIDELEALKQEAEATLNPPQQG